LAPLRSAALADVILRSVAAEARRLLRFLEADGEPRPTEVD